MKEFDEKQNLDGATNENQNPNNAEDKKDLDKAAKLAEIKAEKIQRLKKSIEEDRALRDKVTKTVTDNIVQSNLSAYTLKNDTNSRADYLNKLFAISKKIKNNAEVDVADENCKIFGNTMNYEQFCYFFQHSLHYKESSIGSMMPAMFNLLSLDEDGAAYEMLKTIDTTDYTQMKTFYKTILIAVEGKEQSLQGEYKKSYELITKMLGAATDQFIPYVKYRTTNECYLLKKNEEEKFVKDIKKTLDADKKEKKDNPQVKVYLSDFVDLINLAEEVDVEYLKNNAIIKKFFTLNTDQERWDYFMKILDSNTKLWEYTDKEELLPPLEIRSSGDLETIKNYYTQNITTMNTIQKCILLRRMHSLEKSAKIQKAGEENEINKDNLGENSYNKPLYTTDEQGNVKMSVDLDKAQSSNNGCWSCGIEMMLKSQGIYVTQEDIRSFRPNYSNDFIQTDDFKQKVDANYIVDDVMSVTEMADHALAFAPNKMMRSFEISMPGFAQSFVGINRKIDMDAYINASAEAAAKKIRQVLNEDKCSIAFTNGAHYYSITDIQDDQITCINSIDKSVEVFELKGLIRNLYTGAYTFGMPANFKLTWLSDIELTEDGKGFYNVPSHYLGLDENGNYKMPPEPVQKDANVDKSMFEQSGIKVMLVGGKDDTAYDRIKRNPLTDKDLYITEQAYLPKKLNMNVLKKRAESRTPERTEELKRRRDALLGTDFVAPQYDLSEQEMDKIVREHDIVTSKISSVIEFQEANGIFNVPEEQKRDAEGREYLYYKTGAIAAYRLSKTYEGLKTYLNYMIQFDGAEKYTNALNEVNKTYDEFVKKMALPENAITNEVVPEFYPFAGYPKSEKDITEAVLLLSNFNDKIDLLELGSSRQAVTASNKYNPSVLARFAENVKEFSNPKANTNLLKSCSESQTYRQAVESMVADPGLVRKTAGLKYMSPDLPETARAYIENSKFISSKVLEGTFFEVEPLHFDSSVANKVEDVLDVNELNEKIKQDREQEKSQKDQEKKQQEKNQTQDKSQEKDLKEQQEQKEKINTQEKGKDAGSTGKAGESVQKEGVKRSEKRRNQYRKFLEFMGESGNDFKPDAVADLGKLLDDLMPYLEPDTTQLMSYEQLESLQKRYIKIQKNLESDETRKYINSATYKKFRQVMSKDLRLIYETLKENKQLSAEDRKSPKFNLVDLFEKSRAVTLKVDENTIEKAAGGLSTRLHIKAQGANNEPVDGYFTIHEKPFVFEEQFDSYCNKVAGGDPDIKGFLKYIMNPVTDTIESSVKRLQKENNSSCKLDVIHMAYDKPSDYRKAYTNAMDIDVHNYCKKHKIKKKSKAYQKIKKVADGYVDSIGSVDKLIEDMRVARGLGLKRYINSKVGINGKSKIDKRNSAMSMVAEMLGIGDILAKSVNMRIEMGGKVYKGTFMDTAKGTPSLNITMNNELSKVYSEALDNPEFIKSVANLQILDYICGNTDRHAGNFTLVTEKVLGPNGTYTVKVRGVQGIDNDTSFGTNISGENDFQNLIALSKMLILPKDTADRIAEVDDDVFRTLLIGFDLTSKEIDVALSRLHTVQDKIRESYRYFEKNKSGNLTEKAIKIVTDEDISKISLKNDLLKPKYKTKRGSNHYYNMFSRIYGNYKVTSKSDAVMNYVTAEFTSVSVEANYKAEIAYENIKNIDAELKKMSKLLKGSDEYRNLMESVSALSQERRRGNKNLFVSIGDGFMDSNRGFGPVYQKAVKATNDAQVYVDKQRTILAGLEKNTKEYRDAEKVMKLLTMELENLQKCRDAYKVLTEQPAEFDKINQLKNKRRMVYSGKSSFELTAEEKVQLEQEKIQGEKTGSEEKEENIQDEKIKGEKNQDQKVGTEDKGELELKPGTVKVETIKNVNPDDSFTNSNIDEEEEPIIKNNEGPNENLEIITNTVAAGKATAKQLENARALISNTRTLANCYTGMRNELIAFKDYLIQRGSKSGNKPFEEDGNDEYKEMAAALNDCIDKLNPERRLGAPTTDEVSEALKKLNQKAHRYYDTHYKLMGIPVHKYGRIRLAQAEKIYKAANVMILTHTEVVNRLDAIEPDRKPRTYGKESLVELINKADNLNQNNTFSEEDLNIKEYAGERRIAASRVDAIDKVKAFNKPLFRVYSRNKSDEYLSLIQNRERSTQVEKRAELYTLYDMLGEIFDKNVTPDAAEKKASRFSEASVKERAEKLSKNQVFKDIQEVCRTNNPDNGISMWKSIEKKSDEMKAQYKNELAQRIHNKDQAASRIMAHFAPAQNTPEAVKAAMKALYKEAAEVFVRKALLTQKGREVLQMMAVEDSANKMTDMVNNAAAYLERKEYFSARNTQEMTRKVNSALNKNLENTLLKEYLKTNPRANVDRIRHQDIQTNITRKL